MYNTTGSPNSDEIPDTILEEFISYKVEMINDYF